MPSDLPRRDFLWHSAAAATGAAVLAKQGVAQEAAAAGRNVRADRMPYRTLGRTGILASRLVFGCGAALAGGKAVRLLDRAYEAGVNYYDVGSNDYYRQSENYLAPFVKKHQGDVWVASKGYARSGEELDPAKGVTTAYAKSAAAYWRHLVENSLKDLDTDHIDAYYVQGAEEPDLVKSDEMGDAFAKVKAEGKVGFIGVSSHHRAQEILETAVDTGWYDIVMVAITPAGWYNWKRREMLEGTPRMTALRPVLDKARAAGIGLIGMKTVRLIAPERAAGQGDETAFDPFYDPAYLEAPLSPFQRAYAYVLEHGLDLVNSDMQNHRHFEENLLATRTSQSNFA